MNPPLLRSASAVRVECSRGHDLTDPENRLADARYHGCRQCRRDRDRESAKRRRVKRIEARAWAAAQAAAPAPVVELAAAPPADEYGDAPLVVTRPDGVECYRIDEWTRRFGRPGIFLTILEDDR